MEETLKLILDKISSMDAKISSMDDKISTMDAKISSMDAKISSMDAKINSMDVKINSMDAELKDVKKHVMVIENDHGKKLDSLFDGYSQVYEKLQEHDRRFDRIESGLEKQDVEIRVIKGGKQV